MWSVLSDAAAPATCAAPLRRPTLYPPHCLWPVCPYQNVYFDSGSEAGKFVESIYAYPTTYVVNRSGRIVGDPIVGAITSKTQADALQAQIDKALAADMG